MCCFAEAMCSLESGLYFPLLYLVGFLLVIGELEGVCFSTKRMLSAAKANETNMNRDTFSDGYDENIEGADMIIGSWQ